MPEDLKPCPFCGSDDIIGPQLVPDLERIREGNTTYLHGRLPTWWMACSECSCGMETEARDKQDMIKAWNTRV